MAAIVEFDLKISKMHTGYASVVHLGNRQYDAHPEIQLIGNPSILRPYIKTSRCNHAFSSGQRTVQAVVPGFKLNTVFKIKIVTKNYNSVYNWTEVYVNGIKKGWGYTAYCYNGYKGKIYAGNPWIKPAD